MYDYVPGDIITLTIAIASELDVMISGMESTVKIDKLISMYTIIIIGSPITIALGRFLAHE